MRWFILIICFMLLAGCSTTKPVELGYSAYYSRPVDVYIIPLEGLPESYARMITEEISKQHKLYAKSTTTMGLSPSMFDSERKQYVANRIAEEAYKVMDRIKDKYEKTFFMVITNQDINSEDFHLRFYFATHFKGLSIISTARIDPVNFGEPANEELKKARLMKLINKAIGQQVYKYPRSSDIRSVMYGPIMSLEDLDQMGSTYSIDEQTAKPN